MKKIFEIMDQSVVASEAKQPFKDCFVVADAPPRNDTRELKHLNRLMAVFCLVGLLFLTGCGDSTPKLFSTDAGGFKIMMPGKPKNMLLADGTTVYSLKRGDNVYLVTYWFGEKEPDFKDLDVVNRFAWGRFNRSMRMIEQNGLSGDEYTVRVPDSGKVSKYRDLYTSDRTYRVWVIYDEEKDNLMDPDSFLDSFELL